MKYPCEMIKDLLPLYVDGVCSQPSHQAVEEHLAECDSCQTYRQSMVAGNIQEENLLKAAHKEENAMESAMENAMNESLKKVKTKINRRTRHMMLAAALAVLLVLAGWNVLFSLPLKTVPLEDVRITAESYKLQDLPYAISNIPDSEGNDKVTISLQEYDAESSAPTYSVEIPALPDSQLNVTEDMLNTGGYVSVVSVESRCRLAKIDWDIDGDVMYIHTFKTTLLGRHTEEFGNRNDSIDFRPINKVVYLDGTNQTVLWQNEN